MELPDRNPSERPVPRTPEPEQVAPRAPTPASGGATRQESVQPPQRPDGTPAPPAPAAPGAQPGTPQPSHPRPATSTGTSETGAHGSNAPRPIAPKEYYSISEVCEMVGLKPHVLRYWESQFPVLNPSKNRSGNRVYQRKEIKLVLLVQHLLYKEKYTIEGARQRLDQLRRGGQLSPATDQALDSGMVALLRDELRQLLDILTP